MTEVTLNGVAIKFPFKPYQVQVDYMTKVIECLQNGQNGVLESPTGTGKTLSLLCSSLAWLMIKKAQMQIQAQSTGALDQLSTNNEFLRSFSKVLNKGSGKSLDQLENSFGHSMPTIIYASRTHSQLSQAIQELKRTSYNHVNAAILGSRDQLCINPEVAIEKNSSNKIFMCQAKVKAGSCLFYNNYKKFNINTNQNILDIEDLVKTSKKNKCCPYFLSKDLKESADIIFMPYNYLLDPKIRKNQGIELKNKIILLDEAHNIEKICEEAASLQFSSTDIAVCINEITDVMKEMANEKKDSDYSSIESEHDSQKDFSAEDLCILKAMFLELEKSIDNIEIKNQEEGEIFPGDYIFNLLGTVDITHSKYQYVIEKLDKIILYLTTVSATSFTRKGNALKKFCDLLHIVFTGFSRNKCQDKFKEKIRKCYKVYVQTEQVKKPFKNDVWTTKKITKSDGKLICYWCFSSEFRMQQLLDEGVRSIILTSGTLSPLKPFISEIGIDISVQLESSHIITEKQIYVGIVSTGYNGYCLNSSYNTRNDPKYIASLGETIKILSCILPHGLLVFFPSYPILKNCQEQWQSTGIWTQIESYKPIFVEAQSNEIFNNIIKEYYKQIEDPMQKGAILMGVCRGKVSEGLDFANANGRTVLITGLPFPPLKDPRVILKQRYLEENRSQGQERLTGQQWYQLEASRAVNQAVGRIIRHKNDYGAILLCDCRFDNQSFKQQLSKWIRPHLKKFPNFETVIKGLREFFKYTKENLPDYNLPAVPAQFDCGNSGSVKLNVQASKSQFENQNDNFDIDIYKIESNDSSSERKINKSKSKANDFGSLFEMKSKAVVNLRTCKLQNLTQFSQEPSTSGEPSIKRKKLKLKPIQFSMDVTIAPTSTTSTTSVVTQSKSVVIKKDIAAQQADGNKYIQKVKMALSQENYNIFKNMLVKYRKDEINFDELSNILRKLFVIDHKKRDLLIDFRPYLKKHHLKTFDNYVESLENFST
ncbi:PREDICTED: regulator of telomere elongation helicase 1 homolog [Ceratosolen solmsi marchali]|uniref:Regulator of telomere elongation helicase 1 homolog n=1 Tax=Ceratosolen solmsi marchali TaxID=326594 RepID=A0AAJ7DZG1_9HYME|nr:PREDICTED: regulator of telomere elongation helicase 1 homolog [Ceratosolen solmsi marchali]